MTYYEWLVGQIADENVDGHYSWLLFRLYKKEYYYVHPMDRNRDLDGRELRKEYLREGGILGEENDLLDMFSPSSVLEVLVAFTRRIQYQAEGFVRNNSAKRWFWEMVRNLGLIVFTDSTYGVKYGDEAIDAVLDRWMSGNFDGNGHGSPFPVETKEGLIGECRDSFRNLDLYYQFMAYFQTKYFNVRG